MPARNSSVDIAKFLCAVFVVGIHTRPLSDISKVADFILCDIIFRVAVPFFAVCTGYFLTLKFDSKEEGGWSIVKSMSCRVLFLYIIWSVFYLIVLSFSWYKGGILGLSSFVGWIKSFLLGSSYYHLWYLAQLFWALFFFYFIVRFVNLKWQIVLSALLWLIGSFTYVYSEVLGIGLSLACVYDRFGALTGMIGRMLPLLLLGSILARRAHMKHNSITLSFLMLGCLTIEVFGLKHFGAVRFSYVLFSFPLSFFLFYSVKQIKLNYRIDTRFISKASMNLYLLHPAFLCLLKFYGIQSALMLFILGVLITSFIVLVIPLLWNKDFGKRP